MVIKLHAEPVTQEPLTVLQSMLTKETAQPHRSASIMESLISAAFIISEQLTQTIMGVKPVQAAMNLSKRKFLRML